MMSRKILVAFDLYAFIKPSAESAKVKWVVDPIFWKVAFGYLISEAKKHNIDIYFQIICKEETNDPLYKTFVDTFEIFKNTLACKFHHVEIQNNTLSNYSYNALKPHAVSSFAKEFSIPNSQCIYIDETLCCLAIAGHIGIRCLSMFNYANPKILEQALFDVFEKSIAKIIELDPLQALLNNVYNLQHNLQLPKILHHYDKINPNNVRLPYLENKFNGNGLSKSCPSIPNEEDENISPIKCKLTY